MKNPKTMKEVTVYKIDAARRQTDQAIRLFFSDQDAISIHSLAGAAHQILRNMVGEKNSVGLYDGLLKIVKPARKKELIGKLNQAKNFFKHADRKNEEKIIFRPETNEFILYDNTALYEQKTGELTDLMKIFKVWFNLKHTKHDKKFLPDLTASINNKMIFFEKARREIGNIFSANNTD